MFYTGVGSRTVPESIVKIIIGTAKFLSDLNITLRSGGADGCDKAFEIGSLNNKEIYLPWKGFNNSTVEFYWPKEQEQLAHKMAATIHPAWEKLTQGAKKLHARNCHQVLGMDLMTPSKFTLCYTENGEKKGGTRTAIILSEMNNIPVFNLGSYCDVQELKTELSKFINKNLQ
jgi:hypothetical protein